MRPVRRLILNADDFGQNEAITEGILLAYRQGILTSTSAIVNMDGAPERIAAAHMREPGLPIGLHLNLSAGRPVLPPERVPHLVGPDGTFHTFEEIVVRYADIPVAEIRAELNAQAALLRDCGVTFDHIDYHQHVPAIFCPYFEVVAELARLYGVPVRQPSLSPLRGRAKPLENARHKVVLRFIRQALLPHPLRILRAVLHICPLRRALTARRLGTPDHFVGAFFGAPTLDNFCAILRRLPPGLSEVMTHPALDGFDLHREPDGYNAARPRELAVLLDPLARREVERLGIHLVDFSAARAAPSKPESR